jgi:hypothetical protein
VPKLPEKCVKIFTTSAMKYGISKSDSKEFGGITRKNGDSHCFIGKIPDGSFQNRYY